jgi:hypothetical protein
MTYEQLLQLTKHIARALRLLDSLQLLLLAIDSILFVYIFVYIDYLNTWTYIDKTETSYRSKMIEILKMKINFD